MKSIPRDAAVYVYTSTLDMRVGMDRLAEKVVMELGRRVMEGGYFVFFSRTRDRARIFYWDRDGYAMWTKRLEAGSYRVEKRDGVEQVTAVDLEALFEGMELSRVLLRRKVENSLQAAA